MSASRNGEIHHVRNLPGIEPTFQCQRAHAADGSQHVRREHGARHGGLDPPPGNRALRGPPGLPDGSSDPARHGLRPGAAASARRGRLHRLLQDAREALPDARLQADAPAERGLRRAAGGCQPDG